MTEYAQIEETRFSRVIGEKLYEFTCSQRGSGSIDLDIGVDNLTSPFIPMAIRTDVIEALMTPDELAFWRELRRYAPTPDRRKTLIGEFVEIARTSAVLSESYRNGLKLPEIANDLVRSGQYAMGRDIYSSCRASVEQALGICVEV